MVVDADEAPRTALVAELRDDLLYVFLPPLEELDPWVELINAVEGAAAATETAGGAGGLRAAQRSAAADAVGHPRPRA